MSFDGFEDLISPDARPDCDGVHPLGMFSPDTPGRADLDLVLQPPYSPETRAGSCLVACSTSDPNPAGLRRPFEWDPCRPHRPAGSHTPPPPQLDPGRPGPTRLPFEPSVGPPGPAAVSRGKPRSSSRILPVILPDRSDAAGPPRTPVAARLEPGIWGRPRGNGSPRRPARAPGTTPAARPEAKHDRSAERPMGLSGRTTRRTPTPAFVDRSFQGPGRPCRGIGARAQYPGAEPGKEEGLD